MMSSWIFFVTLASAFLHASWNALLKNSPHKLMASILVAVSGAIISLTAFPFLAAPAPQSYPYIGISIVLQVLYMFLLSQAYHVADMSKTYPIMRGGAPLFITLLNFFFLRESVSTIAIIGVLVLCGGIISFSFNQHGITKKSLMLSLCNALVIASYSVIDGVGARLSQSPIAYTLCILFMQGMIIFIFGAIHYKKKLLFYAHEHWLTCSIAGFGSITSYALALWAMSHAPIMLVAALRESSILFGVLIARVFLNEKISSYAWMSSLFIVAGLVLYRIA
ncbi:EamA family transporter [Dickeya dianthicola]|nr:EamA family transporter [Dickeya dianthicola]MCI4002819.1 EamA family transporter [Dickeya dianthicola]MCI4187960.1 EamA family transporter [Dickeya dianthicola]MCI4214758.1 EamA family transporter [Dickeya dianthicola]MCI4232027.1 EamA family transporter [Dickeya dianthicola]MZH97979.1 EamA family transporter [Dickeya dianthicola]